MAPCSVIVAEPQLLDRVDESAVIDDLLEQAKNGAGGSLVIRGGSGLGKSALLAYASDAATGMVVAAVMGLESELELAFAALDRFLAPFLDGLAELPAPQRNAVQSALGRGGDGSPDRFLVGRGVLALLSRVADSRPLLCLVDDAELLDPASAQTLGFVARRLGDSRIALVVAIGDLSGEYLPFEGLVELRLEGLSDSAARVLLDRATPSPLDDRVRDRLVTRSRGNPLALLELPAALTAEQRSGSSPLPRPLPVGESLELVFTRRIDRLSAETQLLLLLIAAEASGDAELFWRAAAKLRLDPESLDSAEAAGIVDAGPPLKFRHSFVRSAVYARAPAASRRRVHRALADATDAKRDPDQRAWHRAAAVVVPDETLAAELESSAGVARRRGGHAAAARLLLRAAELTPDRSSRTDRLLGAAQTQLTAGSVEAASALVIEIVSGLPDVFQRARAQRLSGAIELARGSAEGAPEILLQAARSFASLDARLARDTYLEALAGTIYAGRLGRAGALLEIGQAAADAPPPPRAPTAADLLLDGFSVRVTQGPGAAGPALRAGIDALREHGDLRWFGLGYIAAFDLWQDDDVRGLSLRHVQLARDTGAFMALPNALSQLGAYEVIAGRLGAAEAAFGESAEAAAATGTAGLLGRTDVGAMIVAAWRGRVRETRALARRCTRDGDNRGVGIFGSFAQYALAVLGLGRSEYRAALAAARGADQDFAVQTRALPELVEAASRCRERVVAAAAVERLAESVLPASTEWGLGMLARSRALIADGDEAEALYQEAITRLQRCLISPQLARAYLLYGEWLRRMRRRREAREQLRRAHQMFSAIGAAGFAGRARAELAATGELVRRPRVEPAQALTPHELRVARLASSGATNREVAVELYISPRTVEYHLHKVFQKLGITSRIQLARALDEHGGRR